MVFAAGTLLFRPFYGLFLHSDMGDSFQAQDSEQEGKSHGTGKKGERRNHFIILLKAIFWLHGLFGSFLEASFPSPSRLSFRNTLIGPLRPSNQESRQEKEERYRTRELTEMPLVVLW